MKTPEELTNEGFTDSGTARYQKTAEEYCHQLFVKASALGERDKAQDMPREVTHEHVRDAAMAIATRGRDGQSWLQVWCQIGEYLATAAAGVGAGKLTESWGTILFGSSLTLGIVLFVVRNTKK